MLADIHDLSPVSIPLRSTNRIKYTCFNVSSNFLIFGASSGGLYVFRRDPCSFLQLLPNQEGSIVHVAISPDEKLFAFASVKGVVCVLEKNSSGLGARRIFTSSEHIGVNVTALQWNSQSNELFIGDQLGKVSIISLLPFMMKNMFHPPSCTIMLLDSQIVQMDWQADILLVSTLTRSYVCDIAKERFRQIGVKPRDGEYGSCFLACGDVSVNSPIRTEAVGGRFSSFGEGETMSENEELKYLKAFCARPGSRLWEVKVDGTVLNTHQFKQALAIPPTAIIKVPYSTQSSQECDNEVFCSTNNKDAGVLWKSQSFNFCKLFVVAKNFLFTFKKDGVYVFDPEKASVVLWSNDIINITDAKVVKDTIYLRNSSGKIFGLLFAPLDKFLVRLYLRKQYTLCAKLCEIHSQYLMKELPSSSKLYLLADLGTKLRNDVVTERILPLLQQISKCAQEARKAQKLESGIFVVKNRHFLSKEESESSFPELPQLRRTERLKDKSRSLSVSPDRSRRKKKIDIFKGNVVAHRSGSACSLPELGNTDDKNSTGSDCILGNDSSVRVQDQKVDNLLLESNEEPLKIFSKDLFTSFESSPEAIQTLKEIGHSVSSKITSGTKTLKEKWQVLEEKILGNETTPELLDVRTSDFVEKKENLSEKSEEEIVFTDNSKTNKTNGKKNSKSDISIDNIIVALQVLRNSEDNSEDRKILIGKLFDAILNVYNYYVSIALCSSDENNLENEENVKNSNNRTNSSVNTRYFLIEWTQKSFPFDKYFSGDKFCELSDSFHSSLKSECLVTWLQELVPIVNGVENYELLNLVYPKEAIIADVLLSRLLIVCSDLLDPHMILQCIKESSIICYYHSLCTVLDKYQAGALQQVGKEKSVESSCWQWPLPLRLNAMFFMLQMNQIETCYFMGSNIDLQDVWYLILRLQEHQMKNSTESLDMSQVYYTFLNYIDRAPDTEAVMQTIIRNEYLSSFTTVAFETVNQNLGSSCKCGFPFPVDCGSLVQFEDIGQILTNFLWQTNHDRHQQLCERVPVLWKQMLLNAPKDNFKSVLPLLIQLGDFSLLEPLLPFTRDVWKQVIDMVTTVRLGHCLKCGLESIPEELSEKISLSKVGAVIVKSLGAKCTLDLLSDHGISSEQGALDEKFYRLCIFSEIVESQNYSGELRSDVVDLVLANENLSAEKPLVSHELGKQLLEALALDLSKVSVSTASDADADHHWGLTVNLRADPCPRCGLPLGTPALLADGGLTLFRCGHAFHAVCLRQHAPRPLLPTGCQPCLLCSKSSKRS